MSEKHTRDLMGYFGTRLKTRAEEFVVKRMKELGLKTKKQYFFHLLKLDKYKIKTDDV